MKRILINLEEELYEEIKKEAKANGVYAVDIIRQALLDRHTKPVALKTVEEPEVVDEVEEEPVQRLTRPTLDRPLMPWKKK